MATREKIKTKKSSTTKKELDFFSCFTMNEVKGGKMVLKPKLNKYGISGIKIYTNDEEEIILNEETVLWGRKVEGETKDGKEYSFWDVSLGIEK